MDDGRSLWPPDLAYVQVPATLLDLQTVAFAAGTGEWMDPVQFAQLVTQPSWVLKIGGEPIAGAGYVQVWQGRAIGWFVAAPRRRRDWVAITHCVAHWLGSALPELGLRRLEVTVRDGHEEGHRWVKALGFECQNHAPMKGYLPDGGAAWVYAIVLDDQGSEEADGP